MAVSFVKKDSPALCSGAVAYSTIQECFSNISRSVIDSPKENTGAMSMQVRNDLHLSLQGRNLI